MTVEIDGQIDEIYMDTLPMKQEDVNAELIELIKGRMKLGKKRYGHGVILDDDTTKYGTKDDSWLLMSLEEALDGAIYTAAALLRVMKGLDKMP
jgi:hypothetical protein